MSNLFREPLQVQLLDAFDKAASRSFTENTLDSESVSFGSLRNLSNHPWLNFKPSFLFAVCAGGFCTYVKAKLESKLGEIENCAADLLFQVFLLLEHSRFHTKILEVARSFRRLFIPMKSPQATPLGRIGLS